MSDREHDGSALEAVLFDMDGVVTDTAAAHAAAWKALFDPFLARRGERPFSDEDYRRHVDGKPRLDGVRDFLAARGVALPDGGPDDDPDAETVHGLGRRKNALFRAALADAGATAFPGSLALLDALEAAGVKTAVFSASRNAEATLRSAGLADRFAVRVDGEEAARLGLPGKPDPAVLLEAARRLGVAPARAAVVEDARAGVAAGRAGGFAQAIGVDRDGGGEAALVEAGADLVVGDLAELRLSGGRLAARTFRSVPSVWTAEAALARRLAGRRPAVFLDYDGTLSPIVPDPADAVLGEGMRAALERLAARVPVAIVSGRDLADVQGFVRNDRLYFAGSHGFDLAGPGGWRHVVEQGSAFLPDLAAAADDLDRALADISGARVERKAFALAVHFRAVADADEARVAAALRDALDGHPRLKASGGKKVFDVKPRVDWNKGRAVLALLAELGLEGADVAPVYVGDDTTDEDAFRALAARGIGVVVRDGSDRRTAAAFAVDGVEEVERLLLWLVDREGA
jgi:trehalose 6-phosphate phosphatase